MTVLEQPQDEASQLMALLTELSHQLSANRQYCDVLKRQTDELKLQALHTGAGFTLRRFNLDISQEKFDSDLEKLNATLVLENQALQHDTRALSMLLRDYETSLDTVMAKFRTYAHATQQYELEVARHYEALLAGAAPLGALPIPPSHPLFGHGANGNASTATEASQSGSSESSKAGESERDYDHQALLQPNNALLQDPVALSHHLTRLSELVRKAFRAIEGEGGEEAASPQSSHLSASGSSSSQGTNHEAAHSDPTSGGGYLTLLSGLRGNKDLALDREIELEQLRHENAELRRLLSISQASEADDELNPMLNPGRQ
ncbi:uncharacterized protein L969DRAFT_45657 [Mixia osmundae IAM 14324]|uniref:Uncharacterized protein n=1 Tax=Mixia osmundae (strain CBS 9802 / IAM 14324 / JCM 22182 / KY 12970) TaxID=764103 RepID=G7DXT4_MIXOS|nr:uncharacterized protein L969DRAFT_45657 [Mixia osmundae IAM 14324]KEI41297.1 hypothetical protein L969DRAFT_45657 [Mixia osmundae IAM 14324]GAA95394.1 hypothetical protein E5Q_02048 [Mixia osmundae IAM 14324]